MTTVDFPAGVRLHSISKKTLAAAVQLWFLVAVAGQMMFAAYVTGVYGGPAVHGRFEAWNHRVQHRYVPGDIIGNLTFGLHVLSAVILIVGGAAQLVPRLRQRAPRFHRWNGRIYVVAAFAASLAGLYLLWVRGTIGDLIQHLGVTLNAILIMLFAILAVRAAKSRRIDAHRRWALRLFLVVNGVWFFRVGLFLSFALNHGPFGFNPDTFRGPFITFLSFAQSLLPLAVLELYLRAQDAEAPARLAMAAALFVMAVATGIGVFALTMGMWLPAMRAA